MNNSIENLARAAVARLPEEMARYRRAMNEKGRCISRLLKNEVESAMKLAIEKAIRKDGFDIVALLHDNPGILDAESDWHGVPGKTVRDIILAAVWESAIAAGRSGMESAYASQYENSDPSSLSLIANKLIKECERLKVPSLHTANDNCRMAKSALESWEEAPSPETFYAFVAAAEFVISDLSSSRATFARAREMKEELWYASDNPDVYAPVRPSVAAGR